MVPFSCGRGARLGRRLAGEWAGVRAALLCACLPSAVLMPCLLLKPNLFLPVLAGHQVDGLAFDVDALLGQEDVNDTRVRTHSGVELHAELLSGALEGRSSYTGVGFPGRHMARCGSDVLPSPQRRRPPERALRGP